MSTTTKSYVTRPLALLLCAVLAAGVMLVVLASPAWAATYTVDRSDDPDLNTTPTADDCTEAANDCSLRGAMTAANGSSGVADTIDFDQSLSGLTILLSSDLPTITDSAGLTIDGGNANITISADRGSVVTVSSGGRLTLNKLTVADADFGAIFVSDSTLEVRNSTFSGNTTRLPTGGAIDSHGSSVTTVSNSTFSGNTSTSSGGAINADDGVTLKVSNSTFSGNMADEGGAIFVQGGSAEVISTAEITNSTFSGNTVDTDSGGGVFTSCCATTTISNTLLANNTGGNCVAEVFSPPLPSGVITDGGGNLDDGKTCGFTAASSKSDTPAGLDPAGLKDNGGPTETIALCSGVDTPTGCAGPSAAIDAAVSCPPPANDQRGVSRPQGSACDIGAYEVEVEVEDNTAPFVSLTSPLDQGRLNKADDITATFSEKVQNVSTETFILERKIAVKKAPAKFEPVLASVSPASGEVGVGGLATLNPAQDLPKGEYRATITTAVTDLANPANALDQESGQEGNQPKVWTITVPK